MISVGGCNRRPLDSLSTLNLTNSLSVDYHSSLDNSTKGSTEHFPNHVFQNIYFGGWENMFFVGNRILWSN